MADRYAVATGNWNSTGTWSTTSGGSSGASAPVAGDVAYLNAASGAITVTISSSAACATIDCTGFTGTLAFGTQTLTCTVAATFPAGMTTTATSGQLLEGTAGFTLTGGCTFLAAVTISGGAGTHTIHTNGGSWSKISVIGSAARTYALSSALTVGTFFSNATGAQAFSGAYDITADNATFSNATSSVATGSFSLVAGQTFTVTTSLSLFRGNESSFTLLSGTPSSSTSLVFNGLASAVDCYKLTFTDIAYSGSTVTGLDNWYGGTLTRTSGITNRTSADIGGGSGAGAWAHRMIGGGF